MLLRFDYPFNRLKVGKVAATISSGATPFLLSTLVWGLPKSAELGCISHDGDMVVLSMTREQCPWLKIQAEQHPEGRP